MIVDDYEHAHRLVAISSFVPNADSTNLIPTFFKDYWLIDFSCRCEKSLEGCQHDLLMSREKGTSSFNQFNYIKSIN